MTALQFLQDKRVTILGLGATGMSCARFLDRHHIPFSVIDSRACVAGVAQANALPHCLGVYLGGWEKEIIANSEIIIASPGVDINDANIADVIAVGTEVIGDVELFVRVNTKPIVALTGSNGKSTVVSLIAHLAQSCGVNSILAGNIGQPVLDIVERDADLIILELSSFQLETMSKMQAQVGGILNICDDHLDRHQTLENYQAIKQRIYQMSQYCVYNRQDARTLPPKTAEKRLSFGLDQPQQGQFGLIQTDKTYLAFDERTLMATDELPLSGEHNYLNCLAALAYGQLLGWPMTSMLEGLKSFRGLAHRCQVVGSKDGVTWVNDSKATNVGATLAAIEGLANSANKLILIAGGDGKGADFTPLQSAFTDKVDSLIVFGKDKQALAKLKPDAILVDSMHEAVSYAKARVGRGDMVLLSPACASIDMYANYMARGDDFSACVREVQHG
ncbi:UDP-N-acetylmuramoyl-L-alanine--D-glutamate ligase [Thalassotalea litorea]|uniref:UDP-N-acetylmuramoylalanine--D-glutamate ligase n=1 Tax=Thalassotalea litorea TaxID=2020715 RepID=A0A5R9IMG4_9GAMM|nr:UDP-N-acetylmuramoyl-L-alanine--D-glutamate ligase [Thalassotalea litorea]TLU66725.1 UDP-N-acetylmuramoyl-L-alanine--D-glutamate ligase [Thalassotalea litorea]